jgi:hypothetical protein
VEGELADGEDSSADFLDGTVHDARFVGKDAQPGDFPGEPRAVFRGVGLFDADEDEQALPDLGAKDAADSDGGFADALDDGSHGRNGKKIFFFRGRQGQIFFLLEVWRGPFQDTVYVSTEI